MIAPIGKNFPTKFEHFDSEFEAQEWCEKRGFEFSVVGGVKPPIFPSHISDKMRKILDI